MSESNQIKFNNLLNKIMLLLADSCPVPRYVSAADVGFEAGHQDNNTGAYHETPDEQYLMDALRWLRDEGLIRGTGQFVATAEGLKLYNKLPQCLTK
ncbi:hypothetical protein ACCM60_21580 [Pseudomonas chlororaphis subsp. aureofaciens]|uniref:hypothetical protein n=1 Tax=Pseudomonas chlororaphis TaxID=587753 RepID=UPI0035585987